MIYHRKTASLAPVPRLRFGLVVLMLLLSADRLANAETGEERVLLLRTGRVVKGQMRQVSTGWLVQAKHGRLAIPTDQVRFDAENVEEIYLSLRLQLLRDPTVGKHLNLADWCLGQKLTDEAAYEIREAMKLDPQNETARLMLKRLKSYVEREEAARLAAPDPDRDQVAESSARVEVDQTGLAARREVRGLASLKPETANEFVRVVQPILFNGCANARCHGQASKNEFRLDRFRYGSGSHRLRSERNLATILKYIDPAAPGRSRLLTAATDGHSGRTVFHGQAATTQIASLTRWVQTAARELYPDARRRTVASASPFQPQISRNSTPDTDTPLPPRAGEDGAPAVDEGPPSLQLRPTAPRLLSAQTLQDADESASLLDSQPSGPSRLRGFRDVLRETEEAEAKPKNDAFDPDEFNRQYAGRSSR